MLGFTHITVQRSEHKHRSQCIASSSAHIKRVKRRSGPRGCVQVET
jgi:hypothetical protein